MPEKGGNRLAGEPSRPAGRPPPGSGARRVWGFWVARGGIAANAPADAGEDGLGVVAAAADGGVVALGKRGVEPGALHAGDTGGQPDAAPPREETGAMETAPAGIGEAEALKRETVIIIGPVYFASAMDAEGLQ